MFIVSFMVALIAAVVSLFLSGFIFGRFRWWPLLRGPITFVAGWGVFALTLFLLLAH